MCDFRDMFLSQFNVLVISNSSFFLSRIYRCGEQKSEGYWRKEGHTSCSGCREKVLFESPLL